MSHNEYQNEVAVLTEELDQTKLELEKCKSIIKSQEAMLETWVIIAEGYAKQVEIHKTFGEVKANINNI